MSAATLSVCVPNFNHGHYLAQALRSVLDQSFRPAEILVLDDASTDDSWHVIEQFASRRDADQAHAQRPRTSV